MKLRNTVAFVLALLLCSFLAAPSLLNAQNLTQGNIRGTVTDPSGAVVPGATVTLRNSNTGQTTTRMSSATGAFEFALVDPGPYVLTITATNYQTVTRNVTSSIGQVTSVNAQLPVKAAEQTVTVTAEGGVLQTVNPTPSVTMSTEQIALVPNGGGDLSYIAQTSPGSVMNTQGGLGNFASNGVPANANNFTVNSMPENDPFLNLNNSGATNIQLGQNDIVEATVVTNGYSGEYSQPGANVNYVSRSGTNGYHGNASWRWNGRYVNANNFFNKQNSPPTPRGFVNDNQWAASFGGPIRKDKTFFFANTEGLYLIFPASTSVNVPTAAFEQATLANLATVQPTAVPLYQSMFNFYNNAPGSKSARNILANGGCREFTGTAGFGASNPCALRYNSTVSNNTHEWLISARVDHNIGNNDRAFIHFRVDRGVQAAYTDPLSPIFNVTSFQPQYEGQLQETHTFSSNTVNSFNLNGSYYRAIFSNPNQSAALAVQPVQLHFTGTALYDLGAGYQFPFQTPQGRNITQYGFVDDLSHTMGNHTFKVGANLARYDITTYGPGQGSLPAVSSETITNFFNGLGTNYQQNFPDRLTQPINLYNLGFYGQDNWRARSNLTLLFGIRADRSSNPECTLNCFNSLAAPFESVNHGLSIPYNQTILANQSNALPGSYHPWTVQPRFGFTYQPFGAASNLVLSGGFGLFGSVLPSLLVDDLIRNVPGDPGFTIPGRPFSPATPNNAGAAAASAATALKTGFSNGATWADLNAALLATTGTPFSVPNFFNIGSDIHPPRFQEWSFQVQQAIGQKMALTLKYTGNHGIWLEDPNNGLNAYCGATLAPTANPNTTPCLAQLGVTSFAGLPAQPTDPRFLRVTEIRSEFSSNYNGLTVSFLRRLSAFQFQFNYTWSHALDEISNSGQPRVPFNNLTNRSVASPQNPFNPHQFMYGNADYDVRHYFSVNYVYTTPRNMFQGYLGKLLGDWTVAGTIFARSGYPFTVLDTGTGGVLNAFGYGGANGSQIATFANQINPSASGATCSGKFADPRNGPCPGLVNNFVPDTTAFGNQRRNQIYGPRFFNTDLTISKGFPIPHWEGGRITIGATAYNLFNHPNFDQPSGDVADPNFGLITLPVNPPTSIYGSGLGGDSSPRLFQSEIKLTF